MFHVNDAPIGPGNENDKKERQKRKTKQKNEEEGERVSRISFELN